jgi:glycosyltransferase involved in cell wall biosynthesis
MAKKVIKFVLITNIISPYRIPLFNVISESPGIDLEVIFLAKNESNRKWNIYWEEISFRYKILKSLCFFIKSIEMPIYFSWGLWKELKKFGPDAICIGGYHYLATIEALIYAKLYRIKITLWTESHLLSGFIKNPLANFYKRTIIQRFDSYIAIGTLAKEQVIYYGAKPEKIVVGYNTVDVEWFMNKCKEIRLNEISQMKKDYPPKNIIYVGSFIARKGVLNLIRAFHNLKMDNVGLILVGEGPEKASYLEYIRTHDIENVFFEGFVHRENIVKYYKLADILVLPSLNEVWGLAVNEAMACGLPVLSSIYAGVTKDLVIDGINGYSFDPDNINDLCHKLREMLLNDAQRIKMGIRSAEIIKDKALQDYSEKFLEAVRLG